MEEFDVEEAELLESQVHGTGSASGVPSRKELAGKEFDVFGSDDPDFQPHLFVEGGGSFGV